jgi:hypothetical protein
MARRISAGDLCVEVGGIGLVDLVGRPHGVLSEHGNQGVMATSAAVPHTRIRASQSFPRGPAERPTLDKGGTLRARHNPQDALPLDRDTVLNPHRRRPVRTDRRRR